MVDNRILIQVVNALRIKRTRTPYNTMNLGDLDKIIRNCLRGSLWTKAIRQDKNRPKEIIATEIKSTCPVIPVISATL